MNINKVFLLGNLTRNPETRTLPNGGKVCGFGLATNLKMGDKTVTEFHNIVLFGKLAEGFTKVKGDKIHIEGRLQTRQWEGQGGEKRQKTEIVAETIIYL